MKLFKKARRLLAGCMAVIVLLTMILSTSVFMGVFADENNANDLQEALTTIPGVKDVALDRDCHLILTFADNNAVDLGVWDSTAKDHLGHVPLALTEDAKAAFDQWLAIYAPTTPISAYELAVVLGATDAATQEEWSDTLARPLGNVNDNGTVDSTDARLVLQYAVKKIADNSLALKAADVNGNGTVDSTDARLVLQYAVKKIAKLPADKELYKKALANGHTTATTQEEWVESLQNTSCSAFTLAQMLGMTDATDEAAWLETLKTQGEEFSPYTVAVEKGFTAIPSEEKWIESLKAGSDGGAVSAYIDANDHLVLRLWDGTTKDVGYIDCLTMYTVTFESNGGSRVEPQVVPAGNTALEPIAPERSNYAFMGWYADAAFETLYDFSTTLTEDITLYAKWEIVVEGVMVGSDDAVTVYSVSALAVDEGTITATVSAPGNCALIVRFIEEDVYFAEDYAENRTYWDDGYTYASRVIAAGTNMGEVTANISGWLPDYYVAEAVLVDAEFSPLCDPFTSIKDTERYAEYDSKTVYDYAQDTLVLNFDQSIDNNFGALADDVKVIYADDVADYDTDGDGVEDAYRLVGSPLEIEVEDKIFAYDDDSDHLFKVMEILVEGDALIVIPAKADDEQFGFDIQDFYKFLKVDMEYDSEEESAQQPMLYARRARGIKIKEVYENASGEVNFMVPLSFETEHFVASVKAGATIKASLVFEWDVILFGEDYMRCDFTYEADATAELDVHGKWGADEDNQPKATRKELSLGKFRIPFGVTGISAFADVKACVDWEITAGLKAEGHIVTKSGFKYNTHDGFQKIDQKESNWTVQCEGHAELKFGPKPSVGVEFLGGVLSCELECFMGIKAEADVVIPVAQGGEYIHACHLCIDGKVNACVTVSAKLKYKITDHLKGTPIDWTIINYEKKLFDFYVSLANEPHSIYGGRVTFGFDDCENKMYKTVVNTYNAQGAAVMADVSLYDAQTDTLLYTVNAGQDVYLAPKTYIAKATINGTAAQTRFVVTDGAKMVSLSAKPAQDSLVSGKLYDAVYGDGIQGVQISVYENTTLVTQGATDESGYFTIPLDQGNYRLVFAKDGYVPVEQAVVIRENERKELGTIALVAKNDDSIMGGIYGAITDAITGQRVSNVDVKISKGWNTDTSEAGEFVAETTTNSNGNYQHRKTTIMGVDFGLDAGNYTITISKEGYISTTFNVTIVGGEDMEFNSSITPVGAENVYHIVLTWGSRPSDLDSHFNATYNGVRDHVYYSDKTGYYANLDVDDTSSYGPETITIEDITKYSGNVKYSVHDYSNRSVSASTQLASSGAVVKVYRGGRLLETYYVPSDGVGTVWNVFYIDENGNIHAVNTFQSIYSTGDIYGQAS